MNSDTLLAAVSSLKNPYLSVVEPFLDLIHLAILDGVHDVEVFHDDGHIADDVTENRSADDHPHDCESSFEVTGAGNISVPYRGPERVNAAKESANRSSYLAGTNLRERPAPRNRRTEFPAEAQEGVVRFEKGSRATSMLDA